MHLSRRPWKRTKKTVEIFKVCAKKNDTNIIRKNDLGNSDSLKNELEMTYDHIAEDIKIRSERWLV